MSKKSKNKIVNSKADFVLQNVMIENIFRNLKTMTNFFTIFSIVITVIVNLGTNFSSATVIVNQNTTLSIVIMTITDFVTTFSIAIMAIVNFVTTLRIVITMIANSATIFSNVIIKIVMRFTNCNIQNHSARRIIIAFIQISKNPFQI